MDYGDVAAAIEVRVGIRIGGRSVRRPARMADADRAGERFAVVEARDNPREFAPRFGPREGPAGVDHRDSGAVVSAILEPPQRVQDDRNAIAISDVTDDPAHGKLLYSFPRSPIDDLAV